MQSYKFYVDRKVTIWVRDTHSVDAETLEKAKALMIECMDQGLYVCDKYYVESMHMSETEEDMDKENNGDQPTWELLYDTETIKTN